MVCSTAFDRDDEFFATAGVSRHVKVRGPLLQMCVSLMQCMTGMALSPYGVYGVCCNAHGWVCCRRLTLLFAGGV